MALLVAAIVFLTTFMIALVVLLDANGSAECDGVCVDEIPRLMLVAAIFGAVSGAAAADREAREARKAVGSPPRDPRES
jgi:hypothetical protein